MNIQALLHLVLTRCLLWYIEWARQELTSCPGKERAKDFMFPPTKVLRFDCRTRLCRLLTPCFPYPTPPPGRAGRFVSACFVTRPSSNSLQLNLHLTRRAPAFCPSVSAVDTSGAGDAFIGALGMLRWGGGGDLRLETAADLHRHLHSHSHSHYPLFLFSSPPPYTHTLSFPFSGFSYFLFLFLRPSGFFLATRPSMPLQAAVKNAGAIATASVLKQGTQSSYPDASILHALEGGARA